MSEESGKSNLNSKAIVKKEPANLAPGVIEQVIIKGDLSRLNEQQRVSYYNTLCASLGLNALAKPFEYIVLNTRLTLYATRACTDQLRSIHKISIEVTKREENENFYRVYVKAKTHDGRTDEALGMVTIAGLKGDQMANAYMKAETKAKRRVTLSICGLGFLDETEVETIHDAKKVSAEEVFDGSASPEVYMIPFGKYKDMKLEDLSEEELVGYIRYIRERAEMRNQTISGVVQEFIENAEAYLEGKKMDEEFNKIVEHA